METHHFNKLYVWLFPLSFAIAHFALSFAGSAEKTASLFLLVCPLHYLTGFLCPTCGLGRSLVLSWTGNLHHAMDFHFLGPTLALASAYWVLLLLKKDLHARRTVRAFAESYRFPLLALLGLYTVWGVLRNLNPGEWL